MTLRETYIVEVVKAIMGLDAEKIAAAANGCGWKWHDRDVTEGAVETMKDDFIRWAVAEGEGEVEGLLPWCCGFYLCVAKYNYEDEKYLSVTAGWGFSSGDEGGVVYEG